MKTLSNLLVISFSVLVFGCSQNRSKQAIQNIQISNQNISLKSTDSVKDYFKLGSELMQNEKLDQLKIGLKDKALLQILGDPSTESKPVLWGADGLNHKTMKYSNQGVELDLIQGSDSGFSVNMLTITAPCKFKTLKGIGIDSDIESIKSSYADYINKKELNDMNKADK